MRKNIAILLFVMVILFMYMIMFNVLPEIRGWVYDNDINDKITHIVFAAVLTLLANYIFSPRKVRILSFEVLLGTAIMAALFFLDEFLQWPLPGRDANPLDLAASYTGLLAGAGLFHLLQQDHSHGRQANHHAADASKGVHTKDIHP